MINKNRLLVNERVVDKLMEFGLFYKGIITQELSEELLNILRKEKFVSDKVNRIYVNVYKSRFSGEFRDGFNVSIVETYSESGVLRRNYFGISKETIDGWLCHETD